MSARAGMYMSVLEFGGTVKSFLLDDIDVFRELSGFLFFEFSNSYSSETKRYFYL
jgi:hypothetical protein